MGMSIEDFDLCTPHEFEEIASAWRRHNEDRYKEEWERVRKICCYVLAPYAKVKSEHELFPLPWDDASIKQKTPKSGSKVEPDWDAIMKARGITKAT